MPKISIHWRKNRRGLLLPMLGSKDNPMLLFPLEYVDKSELDELVRAILAKQGVTEESEINAVVERAERDSELRIKIAEAKAEVRRLMSLRARGQKLMQMGYRKWKEAYYPAIRRFSQ